MAKKLIMTSSTIQQNFDFFLSNPFSNIQEDEWVAIYDNKIVSHGPKLADVIKQAEKVAPRMKILFSKIKKTAKYL